MPNDYERLQEALSQRASELVEQFPFLRPRNPEGKVPGGTSGNVRRWFQHHYPGVPISALTDRSTSGITVEATYPSVPQAPTLEQARERLRLFQATVYDHASETFTAKEHFEEQAFRKAFGGVSHVIVRCRAPTPEEMAKALEKQWKAAPRSKAPRF